MRAERCAARAEKDRMPESVREQAGRPAILYGAEVRFVWNGPRPASGMVLCYERAVFERENEGVRGKIGKKLLNGYIMKIEKILCLAVALCGAVMASAQSKPGVIAHRGYWKTEGSAQNSIASLQKAIEIGAEGSELDVYITTDGVVVLDHDGGFNGKRIDESSYADLKDMKLANGESIPTFEAFLEVARKQKHTKPIIELKPHSSKAREDAAVDAVLDMVHKAKMDKRVEYISFSRNACERFIARGPKKIKVAYLGSDIAPEELAEQGYTGLDYHLGAMRNHENWFDEAKAAGLEINVWTVNDEASMKYLIEKGVDYITTDEPELLQKVLK